MALALAVDGGGTRTRCVVLDECVRIVGVAISGPSKFDDVGLEAARANLHEAILQACRTIGSPSKIDVAFLGMGGVVSEADRQTVRDMLAGLEFRPGVPIDIDHDIRIALAGATLGQPGIALIAGTGSSCYGRNSAGESWRSGGWGYLLDDLGSGFYLGLEAIKATLRAHDGRGPATAMAGCVMEALGLQDLDEIMHRIYYPKLDVAGIAALAPIVIALAPGDPVARGVIDSGCAKLAAMVAAVAHRLRFGNSPTVAPVGGLATSGPTFREPLDRAIMQALPGARIIVPLAPPLAGAALLALAHAGIEVDSGALQGLGQALESVRELREPDGTMQAI